jgi:hypothetical protein
MNFMWRAAACQFDYPSIVLRFKRRRMQLNFSPTLRLPIAKPPLATSAAVSVRSTNVPVQPLPRLALSPFAFALCPAAFGPDHNHDARRNASVFIPLQRLAAQRFAQGIGFAEFIQHKATRAITVP